MEPFPAPEIVEPLAPAVYVWLSALLAGPPAVVGAGVVVGAAPVVVACSCGGRHLRCRRRHPSSGTDLPARRGRGCDRLRIVSSSAEYRDDAAETSLVAEDQSVWGSLISSKSSR